MDYVILSLSHLKQLENAGFFGRIIYTLVNVCICLDFSLKTQGNLDGGGREGRESWMLWAGKVCQLGLNLFVILNLKVYYFIRFTLTPMSQPNHPQPTLKINSSVIPPLNLCPNLNISQPQLKTQPNSPAVSNSSIQSQIQHLQKQQSKGKKGSSWDRFEQLYYFDAIVRFVIENPYLTLSWAQWKPQQYYNFIADRMSEVFGEKGRKANQLKTKDQNLKNQYYNRRDKKIDLVDVALSKVIYFVNKMKKLLTKGSKTSDKIIQLYNCCDQTLRSYRVLIQQMKQPKHYELELIGLIRFIEYSQRRAKQAENRRNAEELGEIGWILQEQVGSYSHLIFPRQL